MTDAAAPLAAPVAAAPPPARPETPLVAPVATPVRRRRARSDWRGAAFAAPYLVHLALFFG